MSLIKYTIEALKPGGTPRRYLIWVSINLVFQALFSLGTVLLLENQSATGLHYVLFFSSIAVGVIGVAFRNEKWQIGIAYFMSIVGIITCCISVMYNLTTYASIVFLLNWWVCILIAERREYLSFSSMISSLSLIGITAVLSIYHTQTVPLGHKLIVVLGGSFATLINIYLLIIEFEKDKNYFKESRKGIKDLDVLSRRMVDILSAQEKLELVLWNICKECIPLLGLEDCVIYLYNEERNVLVQVAAYGEKMDEEQLTISEPIEIHPGEGIVGNCFLQSKTIMVEELEYCDYYIVDGVRRNSELAVPIISNNRVIGVIDSEHSTKGFFRDRHHQAFQTIAHFCGIKITDYSARESLKQMDEARMETEKYKELDELKNRFITNISHDLKTPLSLIKGPALQIRQHSDDPYIKKLSGYMLKNIDHLLRVVNQLLQLNRLDQGLNQLYLEEVEISALLQKIDDQYGGLSKEKGIDLIIETENIRLRTDAFRLEQILHNLIQNAFRYTQKDAIIQVKTSSENDNLIISVTDNGPGIDDNTKAKIFERFFKGDVNNHEGTGIGLSLVKEYVTSIGGEITVESEVNKGTKFTICLPLKINEDEKALEKEQEEKVEWDPQQEEIASKPIMLIVEDHIDLNNFIFSHFEQSYHCLQAFDGVDALEKIENIIPDIIITDLMMPRKDGRELVNTIRENDQTAHIPVVILTAKDQLTNKIEMYQEGVDNYMIKPFDVVELQAIVTAVLQQRLKLRTFFRAKFLQEEMVDLSYPTEDLTEDLVTDNITEQAMSFVLKNIDDDQLSVMQLAEELGMGRNRLQREIKTFTGLTPVEFVRTIRLNEAKKKLLNRSFTVSEVAYAVGFNNLSYFSRTFKAEFGVLPTEWQQEQQL